jgi:NAD(P)-dependent dehydrogenase (short-subunit alcohol dehydrogenase family)
VIGTFSRIAWVVNNVSILRDTIFRKMSEQGFDSVLVVRIKGWFNISHRAAPFAKEQGSDALVHMTSTSVLIGDFGHANHRAAKMGGVGLWRRA